MSNASPQKSDRSSRTVAVQTPAHRRPSRLAPHRRSVQSQSRAHRRSSEIARRRSLAHRVAHRRTSLDGHCAASASAFTLLASVLGCSGAPSRYFSHFFSPTLTLWNLKWNEAVSQSASLSLYSLRVTLSLYLSDWLKQWNFLSLLIFCLFFDFFNLVLSYDSYPLLGVCWCWLVG